MKERSGTITLESVKVNRITLLSTSPPSMSHFPESDVQMSFLETNRLNMGDCLDLLDATNKSKWTYLQVKNLDKEVNEKAAESKGKSSRYFQKVRGLGSEAPSYPGILMIDVDDGEGMTALLTGRITVTKDSALAKTKRWWQFWK